jgi:hypothetical protein
MIAYLFVDNKNASYEKDICKRHRSVITSFKIKGRLYLWESFGDRLAYVVPMDDEQDRKQLILSICQHLQDETACYARVRHKASGGSSCDYKATREESNWSLSSQLDQIEKNKLENAKSRIKKGE